MFRAIFMAILLTGSFQVKGQESKSELLVGKYEEIIQFFPEINTGTHYIEENRSLDGHPFYLSAKMDLGAITIAENHFENVPLQYDIWEDWVISFSSAFHQRMILNHLKIDSFKLNDSSYFVKKEKPNDFLFHRNGFYREIETGEIGLYAKHRKQKKQETSTIELVRSYEEVIKYFFEIEGKLVEVPKKSKIFETLGMAKKTAKKELKALGLRYKKNRETYLRTLVNKSNNVQQ
ncbi:hypothetical protein [Cyclobacterium marinum]|uniref:hypothetical protein n=1 Tax=Cyclobacterium marinum TaxID=104 RepID=UPI0030DC0D29|tara:strand:- start:57062 stop:57763 length:702 start_codon:yes stop_codon:yes gene_type:complete